MLFRFSAAELDRGLHFGKETVLSIEKQVDFLIHFHIHSFSGIRAGSSSFAEEVVILTGRSDE